MRYCACCGHELGVGRFCTNCGQPVDRLAAASPAPAAHLAAAPHTPGGSQAAQSTQGDTEERRAARREAALTPAPPRTPPSANDTPAPPRFPLYADEVRPAAAARAGQASTWPSREPDLAAQQTRQQTGQHNGQHTGQHTAQHTAQTGAQHAGPQTGQHAAQPGVAPGGGLLDRFGEAVPEPSHRTPQEALAALHAAAEPELDEHRRRRGPWVIAAAVGVVVVVGLLVWLGTRDGDTGATDPGPVASSTRASEPTDLAGEVTAQVPGTAPDAEEAGGGVATFDAANMLDANPVTAWRVAGDASGKKIVFTFPEPVTLSRVGLINGYAKSAVGAGGKRFDWYHGNRTIAKVAWGFDDQTTLDQSLERNRRQQTLDIDDVTTKTITLQIIDVRPPGSGRARRDFTAISDVTLVGVPAS